MSPGGPGGSSDRREDHTRLLQVLSPVLGRDEEVDWSALESAWGIRFPSDYKSFMSHYGAGGIDDSLTILPPGPPVSPDVPGYMGSETENVRELWRQDPHRRHAADIPSLQDDPPLLAWAVSDASDVICWFTEDGDPDQWPVLIWKRQARPNWKTCDKGMAGFLCSLVAGEFSEWPLSTTLSAEGAPKFINRREEQRMLDDGIDPWTGERDVYADLSFDD